MTRVLLLFLDGVGLGPGDPRLNPFLAAELPNLTRLLEGHRLTRALPPFAGKELTLVATDACLGVPGDPQSATGQAALLTGINVPARLGYHYGPKPNAPIRDLIHQNNLLQRLHAAGKRTALLNAYPPAHFESLRRSRRLPSAIVYAFQDAGVRVYGEDDLRLGCALSADFTGIGWRDRLGYTDTPVLSPAQAGTHLAQLGKDFDFAVFDCWITDYAGHGADMGPAVEVLEILDEVIGALHAASRDSDFLTVITSDHGNLENLAEHGHTRNPVPTLLLGPPWLRQSAAAGMADLTGLAPAVTSLVLAS